MDGGSPPEGKTTMRSRLVDLFGSLLFATSALAACGDDQNDSGTGGIIDNPSGSTVTTGDGPASSSTVDPSTTGSGGAGGSGGAPHDCAADPIDLWGDPVLDGCANTYCCEETVACADDFEACAIEDWPGADYTNPIGNALAACVGQSPCLDDLQQICDSDIGYSDPWAGVCLERECCAEYEACRAGGEAACSDCFFEGGGPLCDAALMCDAEHCGGRWEPPLDCDEVEDVELFDPETDACGNEFCCEEMILCASEYAACFVTIDGERVLNLGSVGGDAMRDCMRANCVDEETLICESSLTSTPEDAACLSENCCDQYMDCTDDGENGFLCVQCMEDGPPYGPRCAAAVACAEEFCPFESGEGGGGGAGGGSGGAGGGGGAGGSGGSGGEGGI